MDVAGLRPAFHLREQAGQPFPYFLADGLFELDEEQALLDWLEGAACWRLVETDFYEQYEFSLFDAKLPAVARSLVAPDRLASLRATMEDCFDCALSDRIDAVAHKLVTGQRIAIHNDFLHGEETHRLTIQLNRGLVDSDGGFFLLFNSFDASDVHRILRPASGTAIGFEIGPDSHHAVSRLHGGERYTLVFSFHARRPPLG